MKYIIDEKILNDLIVFLAKQPFEVVYQVIPILKNLPMYKEQEKEKQEEIKK